MLANPEELIETLHRDGFVMFPGLFSEEETAQAHQDLEDGYRKDLQERKETGYTEAHHVDGVAGYTILTEPTTLRVDVFGQSPTFDNMMEKLLTDPVTSKVIRAFAGERIKLRGYNIRRMSGTYNPAPAHEWHRDAPGEFCFGILLTDIPPDEHAATALIRGSHHWPFNPRWDLLFDCTFLPVQWFLKFNFFNRLLKKQVMPKATGASGKRGDAYIFSNATYHGRQPNLHGREGMVALVGAFPTDMPFPDEVKPPKPEILAKLPPTVAAAAIPDQKPNEDKNTILHQVMRKQSKFHGYGLWYLANLERRLADWLIKRFGAPRLNAWFEAGNRRLDSVKAYLARPAKATPIEAPGDNQAS